MITVAISESIIQVSAVAEAEAPAEAMSGDSSGSTRSIEIKRSISSIMACGMVNLSLPININILRKYNSLGGFGRPSGIGGLSGSTGPCGLSSLGGLRGSSVFVSLRGFHAIGGFWHTSKWSLRSWWIQGHGS